MVPELARMAVIIKSQHKTSVMTGNYELGYACGLMSKLSDRKIPEWESAKQLHELALSVLEGYEPKEDREKNVLKMLRFYLPDDTVDEQVRELYEWGLKETNVWKMQVS